MGFLNSKGSVRFSILVGKYLPRPLGLGVAHGIGSLIGSLHNLEITRAIYNNQAVIRGTSISAKELRKLPRKILNHAGRCYFDLYHYYNKPDKLEEIVPWSDDMEDFVDYSQQNQGYVVVAPHLSNFDLVVARLVKGGFIGRVLSYPDPGSGYVLQNKMREEMGMDITPLGDSSLESEIIEYIKGGGTVATGIDRPMPGRKRRHYVRFFGHPSPLPLGYITTAMAADVPIIVVSSYMLPNGNYAFKCSKPISIERRKNKLETIIFNAEKVLKTVEKFILEVPDQWLMYYPVWPDLANEKS